MACWNECVLVYILMYVWTNQKTVSYDGKTEKNIPVEVCLVNTAVGQMHCTQLLQNLGQKGMCELTSEFCVVLLQYETYTHVGFLTFGRQGLRVSLL